VDKREYQIADKLCESLINNFNQFPEYEEVINWLWSNKSLYNKINIQPKGRMAIASANYEGIRYENIAKFHSLYQKTDYEWNILEHMPHDLAIMYFFEQMNTFMLGHYLTEEFYMGKDQPDFFYALGNAFQELQNRGNKKLIAQEMYCSSLDKMEYYFMGETENSFLHIFFVLDNRKVINLIESSDTKPNPPIEIDPEKQVFMDIACPPF
jgi:hypothetical protein